MPFAVPVAIEAHASGVVAAADTRPRTCELVVSGNMDWRWSKAVRALKAWSKGGHDTDCGRVELRSDGARTWVVFTTTDGRHAERAVGAPNELLTVVQALAFTIPEPSARSDATPPDDPSSSGKASSTGNEHAADDAPLKAREAPAPQLDALRASNMIAPKPPPASLSPAPASDGLRGVGAFPGILIDVRGGLRMPGPTSCGSSSGATCTFAALTIGLGVSLAVDRWELGVAATYEPAHATLSGGPLAGLSMSSYSAGLSVARHAPLGTSDLALGAAAGIQLTNESNENATGNMAGSVDQGSIAQPEPRAGAFAGIVVPAHARFRFRPQLAFDVIPSHLGASWSSRGSSLPALPWWSASASLGMQWQAP